jgi:hypothetical protein
MAVLLSSNWLTECRRELQEMCLDEYLWGLLYGCFQSAPQGTLLHLIQHLWTLWYNKWPTATVLGISIEFWISKYYINFISFVPGNLYLKYAVTYMHKIRNWFFMQAFNLGTANSLTCCISEMSQDRLLSN